MSGKKSEEADWGPIERVRVDRIAAVGDGRAKKVTPRECTGATQKE